MNVKYRLNEKFDLGLGYSFTHFSNGALNSPNMGLNTFSPKLSLEYHLNRFEPPRNEGKKLPFKQLTSMELSFFGGVKNVIYNSSIADSLTNYKGVYYPIYGFNSILNRQLTSKSKIGIGFSLTYDGSYNITSYVDHSESETAENFQQDKLSFSVFPSYELVINRLSVVIQPGFYIFRKQSVDKKPLAYQRLGLHYLLGKNLFAGICLRAYDYHVSDFIEWTLGYRISWATHP